MKFRKSAGATFKWENDFPFAANFIHSELSLRKLWTEQSKVYSFERISRLRDRQGTTSFLISKIQFVTNTFFEHVHSICYLVNLNSMNNNCMSKMTENWLSIQLLLTSAIILTVKSYTFPTEIPPSLPLTLELNLH